MQVSHGGTEMGQGLHTKMMQLVAFCLGVEENMVHISETATDKVRNTSPLGRNCTRSALDLHSIRTQSHSIPMQVPNTSPTAASASADLNGQALKMACDQILARLQPVREQNPEVH